MGGSRRLCRTPGRLGGGIERRRLGRELRSNWTSDTCSHTHTDTEEYGYLAAITRLLISVISANQQRPARKRGKSGRKINQLGDPSPSLAAPVTLHCNCMATLLHLARSLRRRPSLQLTRSRSLPPWGQAGANRLRAALSTPSTLRSPTEEVKSPPTRTHWFLVRPSHQCPPMSRVMRFFHVPVFGRGASGFGWEGQKEEIMAKKLDHGEK